MGCLPVSHHSSRHWRPAVRLPLCRDRPQRCGLLHGVETVREKTDDFCANPIIADLFISRIEEGDPVVEASRSASSRDLIHSRSKPSCPLASSQPSSAREIVLHTLATTET